MARGGSWGRNIGAEAIRGLCRRGVRFDAVDALNDSLALGALRRLVQDGLSVPEDVAVIGFDNIYEGRFSLPSLTTVDRNCGAAFGGEDRGEGGACGAADG